MRVFRASPVVNVSRGRVGVTVLGFGTGDKCFFSRVNGPLVGLGGVRNDEPGYDLVDGAKYLTYDFERENPSIPPPSSRLSDSAPELEREKK
mmetsp:Transcript_22783/g.28097  ORF Transcript_22783/g.28097 Transcript_22783/m.28097 type:complete len:92 (-) Transcript_22783:210-485(-)